jgi:ribosomal protein L37AE/L43A
MVILLGTALSRIVTLTCPFCGKKKRVERRPAAFRVCPHCHKRYPDPLGTAAKPGRKR